ncbi:MAG: EFR1 family ferrodoxin [Cellulosilyticaceae bacterium]
MQKVMIFYFSGTGNTCWVARKIGHKLKEKGFKVKTASIEKIDDIEANQLIGAADIVGFGYPIYCSDVPEPMQKFMQAVQSKQQKDCFVFCTQEAFSGDGARVSLEFVEHADFRVKWTVHIAMPNNITADWSPLSYRYTPQSMNHILRRADAKVEWFCEAIVANKSVLQGFSKISRVAGSIQRVPYRKYAHKYNNMISFSPKCTHCGYCEKICPAQNITVTPIGNITYKRCMYCMRCYNFCPHTAIRIYGRNHNFKRGLPYKGPTRKFKIIGLVK